MGILDTGKITSWIVECRGDKKSDAWKNACQIYEESEHVKMEGKYIKTESIFNSYRRNTEEIFLTFVGLEKAFFSLYVYAANLCGDDSMGDYTLLKVRFRFTL